MINPHYVLQIAIFLCLQALTQIIVLWMIGNSQLLANKQNQDFTES